MFHFKTLSMQNKNLTLLQWLQVMCRKYYTRAIENVQESLSQLCNLIGADGMFVEFRHVKMGPKTAKVNFARFATVYKFFPETWIRSPSRGFLFICLGLKFSATPLLLLFATNATLYPESFAHNKSLHFHCKRDYVGLN